MKVIALISQKGGAGKSTLAVSLAVAAEHDGRSVAVVDLDPQASATNWSERREAETPEVASSTPVRLESVLSAAEQQGADLVLIDTPPRADQTAISAAKVADLVIIPCRPAILDLETVATTIELVRSAGNQQIVVVLNGVPPRGTRRDQAAEILQSMGIEVCPAGFSYRAAFDHASTLGLTAQEYDRKGKPADEILHVYEYVSRIVYK